MRSIVPAVLLLAAPPPVSDLDADVGGSSVLLRWTLPNDPDIAGVRIRRQDYDTGDLLVFHLDGAATQYDDGAVSFDRDYLYTVQLLDTFGQYGAEAVLSVYLGDGSCSDGCWSCGVASAAGVPAGAVWAAAAAAALGWALTRARSRGRGP